MSIYILRNMILTMLMWCEEDASAKIDDAKPYLQSMLKIVDEIIDKN